MRQFFLIGLAILVNHMSSFCQWKWLNPQPSGYSNTKIIFTSTDSGYLLNTNGDLFKTNNNGNKWTLARKFPSATGMDIAFGTGVICGYNALYVSADNGNSWQKRDSVEPGISFFQFYKADIVSRDTIFIINPNSSSSTIYRSNNRGQTWQKIGTPPYGILSVDFVSSTLGFATCADGIYRTSNGGNTWVNIFYESTSSNVIAIKFLNASTGFAYREFDQMMKTTDGGNTWTGSYLGDRINDIFFIDAQHAYAAGEDGVLFHTMNGGASWVWAAPSGRTYAHSLFSQYFFNDSTGIITGMRGRLLKTSSAGASWTAYSPTYIDVTGISFGNLNTGYATTWNNIYKTVNKGASWSELPYAVGTVFPSNARFDNCYFFSGDTGIVTSNYPALIHKTTNGGLTWTKAVIPTGYDYCGGISFIDSKTGFTNLAVSGGLCILFKTTDGGDTWQQKNYMPSYGKLQFLSDQTGFGKQYQRVLKTSDGGITWTEILNNPNGAINSYYFINEARGFAVGDQGFGRMTSDSGKTWQAAGPLNTWDDLIAVKFYDDKSGYITAEGGAIYKTTDGGLSWKKNGQSSFNDCPVISFTRDSSVYTGGLYGAILANNIAECYADSLMIENITPCSAAFKSVITADAATADSIWYEWGISNFDYKALTTPSTVKNGIIRPVTIVGQLSSNSKYRVRVKILSRGQYYYSDEAGFYTPAVPKPVIKDSAGMLVSSAASGNQWFLNNTILNGATAAWYYPVAPGSYTVRVTVNGCSSEMSDSIVISATWQPAPPGNTFKEKISVYPTPARSFLLVKNKFLLPLEIKLQDINGKTISIQQSSQAEINISIAKLPSGLYFLKVSDTKTGESAIKKILKE
ncbi:MAG: YCF48-related protein [Ferruginibacter sp.]